MAETTGIGWTDSTFNPWVGCTKVSTECKNCYAETLVTGRMGRPGTWGTWGPTGTRERTSEANWRTSEANWRKPLQWERDAETFARENGRRRRVFCASLADVFEPRPELEPWRDDLFREIIRATPSLDWQILTKRPVEALDYLTALYDRAEDVGGHAAGASASWPPLANVWIGVSIGDPRHSWRADVLREIPAAVRFISAEPLLGSLFPVTGEEDVETDPLLDGSVARSQRESASTRSSSAATRKPLDLTGIDWLIVGGESGGRSSRPMHPAWARELRDACIAEGDSVVWRSPHNNDGRPALFFKQWGSWTPVGDLPDDGHASISLGLLPDGRTVSIAAAVDHSEGEIFRYAGSSPTSGGKILDGRTWEEFPASAAPVPPMQEALL